MNINFIDSNDWKFVRDEDLANLFYYSLTFGNDPMVADCLNKWNARYGEINSLFYCKENIANFPALQNPSEPANTQIITPIYSILKQKNVPWGKMSPQFFKDLEDEGFVMLSEFAYDIMMYSIPEFNKDLIDYLIPSVNLDNTRRFKQVARMISNTKAGKELLQYFMHHPDLQEHNEKLFATALLWGCAFNNTHIMDYLHSLGSQSLDTISKKAYSLLNENPNIVTIQTKEGQLGNKEEVVATLGYYKLGYTVPSKEGLKQKMKI